MGLVLSVLVLLGLMVFLLSYCATSFLMGCRRESLAASEAGKAIGRNCLKLAGVASAASDKSVPSPFGPW